MQSENTKYIHETETFLNGNSSGPATSWPRKRRHQTADDPAAPRRVRVFILGSLMLDLMLVLGVPLNDLADAIADGVEKVRANWIAQTRVGGFAAWAARIASRLGGRIWLSAVIPVPLPRLFDEFFTDVDADTTLLTVYSGPVPASIELVAPDGHLLIPRNGPIGSVVPQVPTDIFHRFDCVLLNPGAPAVRGTVLRRLNAANRPHGRAPVVAITASSNWTAEDLALVRNRGYFVFFNRHEAVETADRVSGNGPHSVGEAAHVLKDSIGTSGLIVTLGREGAMILNGHPEPHFSRATAADKNTTGSGDMLTAGTAIIHAQGKTEEHSLDAATTLVTDELNSR